MTASSATPILCPVLIGRAPALAALHQLVEQAAAGQGGTALIAGEAGVGKSRLVAEIVRAPAAGRRAPETASRQPVAGEISAAGRRQPETGSQQPENPPADAHLPAFPRRPAAGDRRPDPALLHGHCFEADRLLPYAPLRDLLARFCATRTPAEVAVALGPAAPELVKIFPALELLLPGLVPSPALEPDPEQRRLHDALAHFITRLAPLGPLLVVVEDLHWCDDNSLAFLLTLARRVAAQPIALLLTYRPAEVYPALARFLAALDRERLAREFTLAPLARDEVAAMIRAIFDLPRPVRADFLDALYALTEGNPFFIEEVLKALIAAGEIFYGAEGWDRKALGELHIPRSVQVAVQSRLGGLSAPARQLLTLAAVAGRRFDFAVLQALTGHDEAELLALVKELIAAQLVVEESAETFAFRHALTRQAVYAGLLARERQALHRAIGEALERLYAGSLAAHVADLAAHFYAAGEWPKALAYSQQAGEKAQALYAPQAAREHFTRALEAAERLSDARSAERPSDARLSDDRLDTAPHATTALYRARGQAHDVLGDFAAARDDYTHALQAARATQDAPAEWQALLDLGFLWTGRDYEHAHAFFQQALELARARQDPALLAHTLNRVGNWHLMAEEPLESRRCHADALALFQALHDQAGLAATLDLLGIASYMSGDLVAGARYYEQAVALFRALGDRPGLVSSLAVLATRGGHALFTTAVCPPSDLADCTRAAEEAIAIARQIGWRAGEASALIYLGLGLAPRGEYARALEAAQAGLQIAAEIEHGVWTVTAEILLGTLYLDLLALPEAARLLEQALQRAQAMDARLIIAGAGGLLASTFVAQGLGEEKAGPLLDATFGPDLPVQSQPQQLVWCARAELALARGEPGAALAIAERMIAVVTATSGATGAVVPRLWHLRGAALAALGQTAEAEAVLQAAQEAAHAQGARPRRWRILASLGKLQYAQGRRLEAAAAFDEARALVAELASGLPNGALRSGFERQAATALPRRRAPSSGRAQQAAYGGLTVREREIAALIAEGRSNREIAAALVVSQRTVAVHVGHILSKLGFTSRAQIAAWVVGKGLT